MHSRAVHKNISNITRLLILSVAYITPHCLQIFYGVSTTHVAGQCCPINGVTTAHAEHAAVME